MCPRSSYPFNKVTCYIKCVTISWTYSIDLMVGPLVEELFLRLPSLYEMANYVLDKSIYFVGGNVLDVEAHMCHNTF